MRLKASKRDSFLHNFAVLSLCIAFLLCTTAVLQFCNVESQAEDNSFSSYAVNQSVQVPPTANQQSAVISPQSHPPVEVKSDKSFPISKASNQKAVVQSHTNSPRQNVVGKGHIFPLSEDGKMGGWDFFYCKFCQKDMKKPFIGCQCHVGSSQNNFDIFKLLRTSENKNFGPLRCDRCSRVRSSSLKDGIFMRCYCKRPTPIKPVTVTRSKSKVVKKKPNVKKVATRTNQHVHRHIGTVDVVHHYPQQTNVRPKNKSHVEEYMIVNNYYGGAKGFSKGQKGGDEAFYQTKNFYENVDEFGKSNTAIAGKNNEGIDCIDGQGCYKADESFYRKKKHHDHVAQQGYNLETDQEMCGEFASDCNPGVSKKDKAVLSRKKREKVGFSDNSGPVHKEYDSIDEKLLQ